MSIAVGVLPRGAFAFDSGYEPVSDGGRAIERLWQEHRRSQSWSATDWAPQTNAALLVILRECATPDWDEPGSAPVLQQTIRYAALVTECLANMVPSGTAAPDIVPERDGHISLTWYGHGEHVFSISVGPQGKLNYAGQFGEEGAAHGWKSIRFDSRRVLAASLDEIARNIARLYEGGSARSAA